MGIRLQNVAALGINVYLYSRPLSTLELLLINLNCKVVNGHYSCAGHQQIVFNSLPFFLSHNCSLSNREANFLCQVKKFSMFFCKKKRAQLLNPTPINISTLLIFLVSHHRHRLKSGKFWLSNFSVPLQANNFSWVWIKSPKIILFPFPFHWSGKNRNFLWTSYIGSILLANLQIRIWFLLKPEQF